MEVNEQEEYKKEMKLLQLDLNLCSTDAERINVLKEHHREVLIEAVAAHNLINRKDFGWKGVDSW